MSKLTGVFLSDIHFPDNIPLEGVLKYVADLYNANPSNFMVILGGDVIDAKGLHGVESMQAGAFRQQWYDRDVKFMSSFLQQLLDIAPKAKFVFLEGNHEERYKRLTRKYPEVFARSIDLFRDGVPAELRHKIKIIPYGNPDSLLKVGDCLFMHGNAYPQNHAKLYANVYNPLKVVYGHLHHFQAFTNYNAIPGWSPRYAVTGGCLCSLAPEWKHGNPHCWVNGFVSFVSDKGVTTPTVHLIEKGKFNVGVKEYR